MGVFLEPNKRFRLPENRQTPVILISAGTGIAPYRSFLQQLEQEEAETPVWMIFGNPHLRSDFLYQREWLDWRQKGLLQHIDCAFSRDQAEKVYVQHKLKEQQKEVFDWLENGAHLYLCGDMKYMAKDVNKALRDIIQTQGGISEEQAEKYVKNLKREKRFQTDVY